MVNATLLLNIDVTDLMWDFVRMYFKLMFLKLLDSS